MKWKWILLIVVCLSACKSKTIYIPVETLKTEYKEHFLRDSIHVYDSVFTRIANDTVWMQKYRYIYKDRLKTDTICQTDSIRIPFPVIETKEVNRLHNWQIILMCMGGILIGFVGYKLVRPFF